MNENKYDGTEKMARKFKELRLAQGLTIEEVSARSGVPAKKIKGIEDEGKSIHLETGVAIAKALGSDFVELLKELKI